MENFKPTNWSKLSYREVQSELANLRSNNKLVRNQSVSAMEHEQPKRFR